MAQSSVPLVFLVGCSRSGTTLLQSLLAAHSAIWSVPETKFFWYANPRHEPKRQQWGLVSRRLRPSLVKFFEDIQHPELMGQWIPLPLPLGYATRHFFGQLQGLTQAQGKGLFLEKTPEHFQDIPLIQRHLPQAKIIHLVRPGQDVVASLYELSQRYPQTWGVNLTDLDRCIDYWLEAVTVAQAYHQDPQHRVVRYDRLVADPPQVLTDLCGFLGLPFEPSILEDYRSVSPGLVRDRERDYKARAAQGIHSQGSQKFYQVCSPEQQRQVQTRLRDHQLDQCFPGS